MGTLNRFSSLSLEKKLLALFIGICIALPFSMARSPLEVLSYSLPLWINFQVAAGFWFASGKPFWQTSLACYGISSVEILGLYFGTFGVRFLLRKIVNWLRRELEKGLKLPFGNQVLFLQEKSGYQKFDSFSESKKKQFIGWLGKQSVWIILLFLFLPLPLTDVLAAIALGVKGLKYGHWYLMAVNLPHIFLIGFLLRLGVNFLFL